MYADKMTNSIQKVVAETNRRRKIQEEYNEKHGITPETIKKELKPLVDPALISSQSFDFARKDEEPEDEALEVIKVAEEGIQYKASPAMREVTFESKDKLIDHLRETMYHAAKNMEFEEAARIRDQIAQLEDEL